MAKSGHKNNRGGREHQLEPNGSGKAPFEDFLADLYRSWRQDGRKALDRVRTEHPEVYFQTMIKLAQLHSIELDLEGACERGPAGELPEQEFFDDFLAELHKLER
jgi:hypothetical protein